jgi:hypothetical protein
MIRDPITFATISAINNLITLLGEANAYFTEGNNLAALGTLVLFDEQAEDLRAAIRLCQMAQRRGR